MTIKNFIVCTLLAFLQTTAIANNVLWYQQPASKWMEALPIGNGRLAAMVYGGPCKEQIALNEISLWSGQADSTNNNLCGRAKLDEMRQCFFKGDPERGNELGNKYLNGFGRSFGTHLPLGDIVMDFIYPQTSIRNYRRQLDMNTGVARVQFTCGNTDYCREYIASYPDQVVAVRLTASKPGAISMNMALALLRQAHVTASTKGLTYEGKVEFPLHGRGGVRFFGNIKLLPEGGMLTHSGSTVSISKANALTIIMDLRTDYNDTAYTQTCNKNIEKATAKSFEQLKAAHTADHAALFSRMSFQLGNEDTSSLPTDTRLKLVQAGATDPSLDALFFQYGRYMLIASSRPNGTPLCANLQGIWNDNRACNMPWTCDYHLDINIQQNYWSANRTNLAECNEPLFNYIRFLAKNGAATARKMYGSRGWVAHTVCNAWGYTAPGWGVGWGMNVTGGAWLATHLWSHYCYTQDQLWLKQVGYPLLKQTALFFIDYMTTDPNTGYLVTGPSISPENGYVSKRGNHLSLAMMPTIDRDIVQYIYAACIASAKILNTDKPLRQRLEKDIKRLPPLQIGSNGQIQEWLYDVRRSDPSHRHSSHLLALFPLNQISYAKEAKLMAAARKGLEAQTASPNWEDTEWSTANMLCFYARLKDAPIAYGWLQNLFKRFTRENLMTVSPAGVAMAENDIFSFDATEASVAGMCEMLLQSYDGCIELLPALPQQWADGSIKGLCAEGGLTVDMEWHHGKIQTATIKAANDCTFYIKGIAQKQTMKKSESHTFKF